MTLIKSLLVVVLFLLIATVLAPSGVRIRGEDALPPAQWETPRAKSVDATSTNMVSSSTSGPVWTCATTNDHTVYVSQGSAVTCGTWSSK